VILSYCHNKYDSIAYYLQFPGIAPHYYAGTYNSKMIKLYVDGELFAEGDQSDDLSMRVICSSARKTGFQDSLRVLGRHPHSQRDTDRG
jgi:hypothetical protein